ncbi:hypothetical protein Ga0100231_004485 [Opitutaceae bacterium TAV4]|nr:hypothetical protein Ga0100231_004485 [Opitutaceae bacterium TAV4]RRK02829.1 hypothetical protein Ga0100230_003650 [Opitutaceae bacterium TAV3]
MSALATAINPQSTAAVLLLGLLVWIVLILVGGLFSISKDQVSSYSVLEIFENRWENAFLWSSGIVLLASLLASVRARLPKLSIVTNLILYLSPFTLVFIGFSLLDALYRNHPVTRDMHQTMGIVLILFYLIGILYFRTKARRNKDEAIAAFLLPPYIVALLFTVFAVFQLLTSIEYIYRNAFYLTVKSVETKGGEVHIDGTFHVNKAAPYVFSAMRNEMMEMPMEEPGSTATLVWEKKDSPSSEGEYAFRITYKERKKEKAREGGDPSSESGYNYEPEVYLQVSLPAENGGYPKSVKSLPISTWEVAEYTPAAKK